MKARIAGVALHLPETVVTNDDLSKIVETNDEWIRTRTGIEERRIFDRNDTALRSSDIATEACKKVLEQTNTSPEEIDGIILGSMYPDYTFPATACVVQANLGCVNAFAYDITAACAFIPFALSQADGYIQLGQAKKVLVIGAELSSRVVNWEDRNTCVLFGDGAAAMLIEASDDESGIITSALKSDGNAEDILTLRVGDPEMGAIAMNGKQVFTMAVTEMSAILNKALDQAGLTLDDVDLLVPHQANVRIIDGVGKKLGINPDKVMVNVQKYGNTSSASVPIALVEAMETGRCKKGDIIATVAIGGGMTWGCNIIRL